MALVAESRRNCFWFGTENRLEWFPTPLRGADVSESNWESGGGLLNGGGYQLNSFGSHGNYIFEWPSSSSREVAQKMRSYASGTYGRGLIYFVDPLTHDTNLFSAMWADPSIGLGYEGASLVYGLDPVALPTSGWEQNDLPVRSAYYDLGGITAGWRDKQEAIFIPIPAGYTLHLGAIYAQSGSGGVLYRTQATNGALGAIQTLTPLTTTTASLVSSTENSSNAGVWVWVGKTASGAGTVTLTAMTARLTQDSRPNPGIGDGPWIGGQGHSGCRFIGRPTYIENTGISGGQVGFAASFREVGSWIYG